MSIQTQVSLRSRKPGALIHDARLAARKTIPECAHTVGVGVRVSVYVRVGVVMGVGVRVGARVWVPTDY
jgi:hypothetical protein